VSNLRQPGHPQPLRAQPRAPSARDETELAARILRAVAVVEAPDSRGTGFLAGPPGLLVTAWHVVAGEERLRIRFEGGPILFGRPLIASRRVDLAVILLSDAGPAREAPARLPGSAVGASWPRSGLSLGSRARVRSGLGVYLAGHPFDLTWFISRGTVGGVERSPEGVTRVVVDAASGPGGSGGPVVDEDGRIVGVTVERHGKLPTVHAAISVEHVAELLTRVGPYLDGIGSCRHCLACGQFEPGDRPACTRCGSMRLLHPLDRIPCPLCDESYPLPEGFCTGCGVDLERAFQGRFEGRGRPGRPAHSGRISLLVGPCRQRASRPVLRNRWQQLLGRPTQLDFEDLARELYLKVACRGLRSGRLCTHRRRHIVAIEYDVNRIGVVTILARLPDGQIWLSMDAFLGPIPEEGASATYRLLLEANADDSFEHRLGARDGDVVLCIRRRLDHAPRGTLGTTLTEGHRLAAEWERKLTAKAGASRRDGRPAALRPSRDCTRAPTRPAPGCSVAAAQHRDTF